MSKINIIFPVEYKNEYYKKNCVSLTNQSMSHSLLSIPFFLFTFMQKKEAFSHGHRLLMTEAGFLLTLF